MLEVAIVSIKCALRDEFAEFKEFFETRGWEKKDEAATDAPEDSECDCTEENTCDNTLASGEECAENDTENPPACDSVSEEKGE